jgi:hypothetical protein
MIGDMVPSGAVTDQQNHLALLLRNLGESAIEIAQRHPLSDWLPLWGYGEWPINMDGGAFAHVAPDAVYIPVMPNGGEEPSVNIGTALPAMLLPFARTRVSWTRSSARDAWVNAREERLISPSSVLGKVPAGRGS